MRGVPPRKIFLRRKEQKHEAALSAPLYRHSLWTTATSSGLWRRRLNKTFLPHRHIRSELIFILLLLPPPMCSGYICKCDKATFHKCCCFCWWSVLFHSRWAIFLSANKNRRGKEEEELKFFCCGSSASNSIAEMWPQ